MEPVKVVVRYSDGRVMKGFTQDFFPNKDRFHFRPATSPAGQPAEILVKDLKAVFFVQDFNGNAQYSERKNFLDGDKATGRKVEVTFKDGEVMVGTTLGYDPSRQGFFVHPADPKCNNIRVFAITSAVKSVRNL